MKEYEVKTLSDYQRMLERFERYNDNFLLPDSYPIIRIDGRRFGPKWESVPKEQYPYHPKIVEAFTTTARGMLSAGFKVIYATVHGDEISLLLDQSESFNLRKRSKLLSQVSSTAAVLFQREFQAPLIFDGVLSELPTSRHVIDYFFWQRKVSTRNFVAKLLFALLKQQGLSPREVDGKVAPLTEEERFVLAEELGHPRSKMSRAQLYGAGVWWEESNKSECKLIQSESLPVDEGDYLEFLSSRLNGPAYSFEVGAEDIPFEKRDF